MGEGRSPRAARARIGTSVGRTSPRFSRTLSFWRRRRQGDSGGPVAPALNAGYFLLRAGSSESLQGARRAPRASFPGRRSMSTCLLLAGNDPRQWSKHNVSMWLEWCTEQFSLVPTDADNFHMNGKALCLLSKADFLERAPKAGDVLFNALQLLLHRALHTARMHNGGGQGNGAVPRSTVITRDVQGFGQVLLQDPASYNQCLQVSPLPAEVDSTVILSPDPSSGGESGEPKGASPSPPSCRHRSPSPATPTFGPRGGVSAFPGMEPTRLLPQATSPVPQQPLALTTPAARVVADAPGDKMSVRLLWDFLQQLLNDPEQKYRHCITWKDQAKGVFKITDPHRLAKLWGMQKNHLNMNFDKMSRAMRYYYRVKILQKEPGERLCYRFLRPPTELRYCKQRSLLERTSERVEDEEAPGALDMSIKEECSSPSHND